MNNLISDRIIRAVNILCICMLAALCGHAAAAVPPDAAILMQEASSSLGRGDFEHAIEAALSADRSLRATGDRTKRLEPLKILAGAYWGAGHFREAEKNLRAALEIAQDTGSNAQQASIAGRLGGLYLARGMTDEADSLLSQALGAAKAAGQGHQASILNNIGTLQVLRKDYDGAAGSYQKGVSLSRQFNDDETLCDILTNLARLQVIRKDPDTSFGLLREAHALTRNMRQDHDKAVRLLSIGRTAELAAATHTGAATELKELSLLTLQEALVLAENLADRRSLSYAYGYLGALHEESGKFDEALRLTRRAILEAENIRQGEGLYLWQWQTGRILEKQDRPREAIKAYRLATRTLETIRDEVSAGCFICGPDFFREKVEPVYFGLAELLFDLSGKSTDHGESAALLLEARQTIEDMKGAELHDYFRDPCVDAYIAKARSLETVGGRAAVLYVIPFEKKIGLLLSLSSGIERYSVNVTKETFVSEVKAFRKTLEKRTTREYMIHGQKLYAWLITPLLETLVSRNIETIVFVPDQWLRTVPLAALHDGREFLVSRFSITSTQGLTLIDPKPVQEQRIDVLMAGITEPVQGYPALLSVSDELRDIGSLYPGKLLKDRTFVTSGLKKELSDLSFSIVHIASHGEFSGDVQKSFLLAWDEKLSMDQLEKFIKSGRFRKVPVELLTLSACQTATGDDKAALGLAGVAVKAGARSAIAALWSVSDEASYQLITEFYRQFQSRVLTKAKALQQAQLSLLKRAPYQHPYYWAPFILIGNWL
ncbi:MAG: hypothetical protein C0402_07055 [Thermodesulfovibrio sp.]|nr:hypothetical protein [Thermodesulfovibrio sp.]